MLVGTHSRPQPSSAVSTSFQSPPAGTPPARVDAGGRCDESDPPLEGGMAPPGRPAPTRALPPPCVQTTLKIGPDLTGVVAISMGGVQPP